MPKTPKEKELKEKWDSVLKQMGELEDKEEEILGKEVAEEFYRRREINPSWDDETKRRIGELEAQIGELGAEIDRIDHEEKILGVRSFLREMLLPEYDFDHDKILRDCLKEVSLQEFQAIARDVLNETNDPKIKEILDIALRKRRSIEKSVLLEKEKGVEEFERSIKENVLFISKYADPDKINIIDVGDEFFCKNLLGGEFTVLDVMRQELEGLPPLVYAIIEVDGEIRLFRDGEEHCANAVTGESAWSLGKKLATIMKYRRLPLKVSIERIKAGSSYFKWKMIR